jgi:hypothetical protein
VLASLLEAGYLWHPTYHQWALTPRGFEVLEKEPFEAHRPFRGTGKGVLTRHQRRLLARTLLDRERRSLLEEWGM